jgi:hypothetical protein
MVDGVSFGRRLALALEALDRTGMNRTATEGFERREQKQLI